MPAGQPFTRLCRQLAAPPNLGRADLHLHTTFSDGEYSPAQIVDLARRSGLAAIAITDHDTLDGVKPARLAAGQFVEVIAGVEISAEFGGREIHVLGYFVDPDNEPLRGALEALRQDRVSRFHDMVGRLRSLGVALDPADLPVNDGLGTLGRRHLADALVKTRRAATIREAFQRYLGNGGRVCVPKRGLPAGRAIALVRGAGGVASWAHPSYDGVSDDLRALALLGLHAVEVDFPSCKPSRARALRAFAAELGLAVTAGSDCHGPGAPSRAVGACTMTPAELVRLREMACASV